MTASTSGNGDAWCVGWHKRIASGIRNRGFSAVTDYIESQPQSSLIDIANDLENVAAVQLQWLWVAEAEAHDRLERCARGLLVRELRSELPEGWRREWPDIPGDPTTPRFRKIGAFVSMVTAMPHGYRESARRIHPAFDTTDIPEGWLPENADDPLIMDIFHRHWADPSSHQPYAPQQGHAWREKWQERLYSLIYARGFSSVTAYVASRSGATLIDLADEFGPGNVAAVQIAERWLAEAQACGTVERCARGLLARTVRKALPKGWGSGWATERVFAAFTDALRPAYEDAADRVCLALDEATDLIPEGWIPESEDDPLIVDIFQRHWTEPNASLMRH